MKAVVEYLNEEKKRLGAVRRKNSGRRNKPFPWHVVQFIDRLFAGEQLAESDAKNAMNVLRRYGNSDS